MTGTRLTGAWAHPRHPMMATSQGLLLTTNVLAASGMVFR